MNSHSASVPRHIFYGLGRWFSRLTLSRNVAVILAIVAVASCVMTYLALTRDSSDISTAYWLLNLDLVLLLLLGTVIARQIVRLWSERRRGIAGAKLHARLVLVFSVLATAPAILMAIFSSVFLYFGVQAWFNERVSTSINQSLEVAQSYLREHEQVMRADILGMANDLNREAAQLSESPEIFDQIMQTQAMLRNLSEAIVFRADGKVLARSRLSFSLEFDRFPQKDIDSANAGEVVLITGGNHDRIRALVRLDRFFNTYLYVGRPVDAKVIEHIHNAEAAVQEYTTLEGKQSHLQITFTFMFMGVALMLLLAAVWFGLVFSEQLVQPIGALIVAAERARAGDLSTRVSAVNDDDEISLLGRAFNRMTSQLQGQQEALLSANAMLDERRRFTETVLAGASSGVIGLDGLGVMTLANAKAGALLQGTGDEKMIGRRLTEFIPGAAEVMEKAMERHEKEATLQTEYAVQNGPSKILLVRITAEQGGAGAVATIDDISALVSAQRKAAWADVARRIAHEIKNPLTPIQLSAERLKRKYLPQIQDDPETFSRCTDTIIRQVSEIGHMVGEFSAYARMPEPVKRKENVIEVCQDALVLQQQAHSDISFIFSGMRADIQANCDRAQLTQVVTNLLQNAIDSIHDRQQQTPGEGRVRLSVMEQGDHISISVEDNGMGLPEISSGQLMEPYVTTKKKGSGLGLAIVRKIMEDHSGSVILENYVDEGIKSGAKAVIVFPRGIE